MEFPTTREKSRFSNTMVGLSFIAALVCLIGGCATSKGYEVAPTVEQDPSIPHVTLDRVVLHAETFGDPQHPPVIVVYGGPGWDYRSLLPIKAVGDQFFVIFYDQRGTGLSPRVEAEELTLESTLADLDALVDHYGQGCKVALIRHS